MTAIRSDQVRSRRSAHRPAWTYRLTMVSLGVAACLWIAVVMAALRQQPMEALAVGIAPVALVGLVRSSWLRVAVVVGGGVLVLGGSDDVGPTKIVYAALILLCAVISAVELSTHRPDWARPFRVLVIPGTLFALVLGAGALYSPTAWSTPDVVRGLIFWLLILVSPILGLDAARTITPRAAIVLITVVATGSALGFATQWLSRRGASDSAGGQWTMSTFVLPAVGFALAFVQLSRGRLRYRWLVWAPVATFILVAMLITGTRANLALFVAVIGSLGSARLRRVTPRAAGLSLAMICGVAALVLPIVVAVVITNPDFIAGRLHALDIVVTGNISADASFAERQQQQVVAQALVGQNPVFGLGMGWVQDQVLDTPWATAVRIGFAGIAALVVFLVACALTIAMSARGGRSTAGHTVASGAGLIFVSMLVLASPVDDHGFGFAMMLLFLLVGTNLREQHELRGQHDQVTPVAVGTARPSA